MAERRVNHNYITTLPQYNAGTAARKLSRPVRKLPADPMAQPERHVKAKVRVAPFMVVGILTVLMLAILVTVSSVRLNAAQNQGSELQKQLTAAQQERQSIQAQYDAIATPEAVENYAAAHGMAKPGTGQTVYVEVPRADGALLGEPE